MFTSNLKNFFHSVNTGADSGSNPSQSKFSDSIVTAQFFERDAAAVARELIGKKITSTMNGKKVAGIILETAAYPGKDDPDTHTYKGETSKKAVWSAGSLYVYSSMGHVITTIATPPYNEGACVLVRAIQLVEGGDGIVSGPGKVSKALGITSAVNGQNIFHGCGVEIEKGDGAEREVQELGRGKSSKAPEMKLLFRAV